MKMQMLEPTSHPLFPVHFLVPGCLYGRWIPQWFDRDRTKRLQVPDRDKEVAGLKALNRGAFGLGVGAGPGDARVSIAERLKESIRSGQSITSTMRMSEVPPC